MTSPSDLSILRVYLPDDLLDQLHALAGATGLPMRAVVRGLLELGMEPYVKRWHENAQPTYEDELSERPYHITDLAKRRAIHAASRNGHSGSVSANWVQPPLPEEQEGA